MRVHHLAIKVSDIERAERFYAALLEAEPLRRFAHEDGTPRSVWLARGEGQLFLAVERAEATGAPKPDAGPGWHTVAFGIDRGERPRVLARALALGAELVRETAYSLFFRDPEGNVVAFSHFPEEA